LKTEKNNVYELITHLMQTQCHADVCIICAAVTFHFMTTFFNHGIMTKRGEHVHVYFYLHRQSATFGGNIKLAVFDLS